MSVLVMSNVFEHSPSTAASRLVLLALADAAHDDGIAWPAQELIAAKARVDVRTVTRTIKTLVEASELEVRKAQRGRRRINVYRVVVPGLAKPTYDDLPFTLTEPFDDRTDCPVVNDDDRTSHPTTTGHLVPNQGSTLSIGNVIENRKKDSPTAAAVEVTGDVSELEIPAPVMIDGRNVPLDVLCEVCGIDPASPKVRAAATSLGDQTKPKIQGIRSLFWIECKRAVEARPEEAGRLLELSLDPEHVEEILADRIRRKAEKIAASYPHLPMTPHVVRDYWLDVELQPVAPGRPTGDVIRDAFREAEARRG